MGLKKNWDIPNIIQQINTMSRECQSTYTDGFNGWSIKQDLYSIKFILDECIKNCPEFTPEKDWLDNIEKQKILKLLKGD